MMDLRFTLIPMPAAPTASAIADKGWTDAHWCEDEGLLLSFGAGGASGDGESGHWLSARLDLPGASADELSFFRYVVWTDCTEGWDDELRRWYAEEHMPGLASVPGTVRARRFEVEGPGPRHFACYDLIRADVLGSQPWLDVRATDWSSRVRPNFRNTRRWMCRTITHERDLA